MTGHTFLLLSLRLPRSRVLVGLNGFDVVLCDSTLLHFAGSARSALIKVVQVTDACYNRCRYGRKMRREKEKTASKGGLALLAAR